MSMAESLIEALRWYVILSLLAWLLIPWLYAALRQLPDAGLSLLRPLGLLLAVLPVWWLSAWGIIPFNNVTLISAAGAMGAAGWFIGVQRWHLPSALLRLRGEILVFESMTLLLFVGYALFRGYHPDIAFTEKPMELAFLNSALQTTSMPPPDPWFAGEPINYYYLGYVLMTVPARLGGIEASVAFNLALATTFAAVVVAATGTAVNIARVWSNERRGSVVASGLLAAVFLVGIGNLHTPIEFVKHPRQTLDASWWGGVGWGASRVISDAGVSGVAEPRQTINEFPAFSFVLGDLHPHVLAYPLLVAALAVGFACWQTQRAERCQLPAALLGGVLAGALYAINSWDMPLAMLVVVASVAVPAIRERHHMPVFNLSAALAAAVVTVAPFALSYDAAVGAPVEGVPEFVSSLPLVGGLVETVGVVTWERSSLSELLTVHGLFLTLAALVFVALWQDAGRPKPGRKLTIAAVVVLILSVLFSFPGLCLFTVPLVVFIWLALSRQLGTTSRYLALLIALAFTLLLVVEIVFLRDAFGDRMNTVFKVYFQVWAIFSIALAAAMPPALRALWRQFGRWTIVPVSFAIMMIAGAALYPPLSAYRWTEGFNAWQGLDGLSHLARSAPEEYEAARWLAEHATIDEHILEAPGCSYGTQGGLPHNRASVISGSATILGWNFHERQWRAGQPAELAEIPQRQQDAATIFNDPNSDGARRLLAKYQIDYVYIGTFERDGFGSSCQTGAPYRSDAQTEFQAAGWQVGFENSRVTIMINPSRSLVAEIDR